MRAASSTSPWYHPVTMSKSFFVQHGHPAAQAYHTASMGAPPDCPSPSLYSGPNSTPHSNPSPAAQVHHADPYLSAGNLGPGSAAAQRSISLALADFSTALRTVTPEQARKLAAEVSHSVPQLAPSLENLLGLLHPDLRNLGHGMKSNLEPSQSPVSGHPYLHQSPAAAAALSSFAFSNSSHSVIFADRLGGPGTDVGRSNQSESTASHEHDARSDGESQDQKSLLKRREEQVRKELHSKEWVALMDPASRSAWASERFYFLQQNPCKEWAVNLIREIDPSKQANIPYKNKKKPSRRPPYWPDDEDVRHDVTPSHLKKEERVKLLVHFLFLPDNNSDFYHFWREGQPSYKGSTRTWTEMLRDVINQTTFGTDGPRRPKSRPMGSKDCQQTRFDNASPAEAKRIRARLEIMEQLIAAAREVEMQSGSGPSHIMTKLPSLPSPFLERLVGQHLRSRKERSTKSDATRKRKRKSPASDASSSDEEVGGDETDDDDVHSVSSQYTPGYISIPSGVDADTTNTESHADTTESTVEPATELNDTQVMSDVGEQMDPSVSQVQYDSLPSYRSYGPQGSSVGAHSLGSNAHEMMKHTQATAMQSLGGGQQYGYNMHFEPERVPHFQTQNQIAMAQENMGYQVPLPAYQSNNPSFTGITVPAADTPNDFDQSVVPGHAAQDFSGPQYAGYTQPVYTQQAYDESDPAYASFGGPMY